MKYSIKCEKMSVTLICGSLKNLSIIVHKGRQHTNPLADEIDRYPWYEVQGTAFCSGSASIHFSSRGCRPQDVANSVAHCMELAIGEPDMEIEIKKESPGKG